MRAGVAYVVVDFGFESLALLFACILVAVLADGTVGLRYARASRKGLEHARPRFSVVVPAYNVERYIEECLDSISAQGRDDVEVVVVDDGSTDSTSAILERWAREQAFINLIRQSIKACSPQGEQVSR